MSLARFREHSAKLGITVEVHQMDHTTHTAEDAAAAVGCAVGAIVKSLVFLVDAQPCLVLVSGSNRVDTAMLSDALGSTASMADAKTVKSASGYSIGGVPPFGHPTPLRTVMDRDLLTHQEVWAAAGAATAVFAMDSARLAEITTAEVVQLA
jgi:prolyl-tRNA editing enzyme YbaK/EbsC (Cys-tRNA(Pro) deacylase)